MRSLAGSSRPRPPSMPAPSGSAWRPDRTCLPGRSAWTDPDRPETPRCRLCRDGVWTMKKLINEPDRVLEDALVGVAAAHPSLSVNVADRYITRAGGPTPGKVGLVSGGGSGHEPLHGGVVGDGVLGAGGPGGGVSPPGAGQVLGAPEGGGGGGGGVGLVENKNPGVVEIPKV